MLDFLFLFRGGQPEFANLSSEELQQHMQEWGAWIGSLQEKGIYKGGEPLENDGNVVYQVENGSFKTDGPFPEAKEMVGGYVMVTANDITEAIEISKGCPCFHTGGTVEVRQVMKMEL